jgi:hypothetical protein
MANLDANFKQDQTWVNSRPKRWRASARSSALSKPQPNTAVSGSSPQPEAPLSGLGQTFSDIGYDIDPPNHQNFDSDRPGNYAQSQGSGDLRSHSSTSILNSPPILQSRDVFSNPQSSPNSRFHRDDQNARTRTHITIHRDLSESGHLSPSSNGSLGPVTADVQESCLLRYFIEELSPWVCLGLCS